MKETKESNSKNKIPRNNNGITLIALVITIIVMLILVSVTISMAVNGGLFEYAGKAVGDTQNALNQEQQLINDIIDEYIKPNLPETEEGEDIVGVDGEIFSAIYTSTQDYTDTNGDIAVIPKGFSVGKSEGINTVDDGLVIQDEDGNQFVWIPVEVTDTDTETSIASFYRSNWSSNARGTTVYTATTGSSYNEPFANGYTEETAEYNAMVKSVFENGGFYIGRYEAGSTTARTNVANGTTEMVVKRDAYPYTYVGWGLTMSDYTSNVTSSSKDQGLGALALSKAMYANKDVGVASTLCYGIQWDAMLDFIKDDDHNISTSTTWGNYKDNAWIITRISAKYTTSPSSDTTWSLIDDEEGDSLTKDSSTSILLTTGASDDFAAKNIFDVAGNVYERTNEALSTSNRVYRGGNCYYDGSRYPASYRYGGFSPNSCDNDIGFRAVLYIS